jgi:hypothetical protein
MDFPSISTSGKGDPLAKIARPPVAACAWAAVHSDLRQETVYIIGWAVDSHQHLEVGFDKGKMMGGVSLSFIASSTSLLNRPPHAERPEKENNQHLECCENMEPMRMFGLTVLIVSRSDIPSISESSTAKLERS